MRKVYRIEGPNGKGVCQVMGSPLCMIYQLGVIVAGKTPDEREHCVFCPAACEDKAIDLAGNPDMVYAFPSLEALRNWFPTMEGREAMWMAGARGWVFEVEGLEVESPYQCIFNKAKVFKRGTFDLVGAKDVR